MTTSSTDVRPTADSRRKTWREHLGLPWFAPSSTPYEVPNVHVDERTTAPASRCAGAAAPSSRWPQQQPGAPLT